MGHKGSGQHSGAKGQMSLARRLTDAEVMKTLETGGVSEARAMAMEFAPEAVKKLRGMMRNRKVPYGVQRMAAKDLIEFGAGKAVPHVNLHLGGSGGGGAKIQINILRFSDNTVEELEVAAAREIDVEAEAVDEPPPAD